MHELYGNTKGLAPAERKLLERIYRRHVPLSQIVSPDLLRSLAEGAHATKRQVGVLLHRSGSVETVIVGDATRLMLPDVGRLRAAEGRFRALRLIHTHLFGEALTQDDFVDLVRLRLDMVVALQLNPQGDVRTMDYAHNAPPAYDVGDKPDGEALPYVYVPPVPPSKVTVDFGAFIADLEAKFAGGARTRSVRGREGRAILVHVAVKGKGTSVETIDESLRELDELAWTAGVEVVDQQFQIREKLDPKYVMGKGKLDEILLRAAELDADMLIFDRNLTASQGSSIAKRIDLRIIDRTQLILDIFAQRAQSNDGKLQVELAQLKYALPRLQQKDDSLSRLTGGIGGRGPGETKLEIGRRRAKERVSHLEEQLKKRSKQREQRRKKRGRNDIPVVAIVGYTNAGKSTLLNTLTGSDVIAEDKLFATLDTRSRRIRFPEEREVVLTDTVGFIRDLPKDLFAAFRATFEEMQDADLLLEVIDGSDRSRAEHVQTTDDLLEKLGLGHIPRLRVYNKADRLSVIEKAALRRPDKDTFVLSALDRDSTRPLLARIADVLKDRWTEAATVPPVVLEEADDSEQIKDEDPDALTTLDEMLGRRARKKPPTGVHGEP